MCSGFRVSHSGCSRIIGAPVSAWGPCIEGGIRPEHSLRPTGAPSRAEQFVPGFVLDAPLGEDMDQAQVVGQIKQRLLMSQVGPHALVPPTSYGEGVGSETAGDLRPWQVRLLLEPHEALPEVVGEAVGSAAAVCALSRHGEPILQEDGRKAPWERPGRPPWSAPALCPSPGGLGQSTPGGAGGPACTFTMYVCLFRWPRHPASALRVRVEVVGPLAQARTVDVRHPVHHSNCSATRKAETANCDCSLNPSIPVRVFGSGPERTELRTFRWEVLL